MVREIISDNTEDGVINSLISLNLHSRFFVSNLSGGDDASHYLMASELYLSESSDLTMLREVDENSYSYYDQFEG